MTKWKFAFLLSSLSLKELWVWRRGPYHVTRHALHNFQFPPSQKSQAFIRPDECRVDVDEGHVEARNLFGGKAETLLTATTPNHRMIHRQDYSENHQFHHLSSLSTYKVVRRRLPKPRLCADPRCMQNFYVVFIVEQIRIEMIQFFASQRHETQSSGTKKSRLRLSTKREKIYRLRRHLMEVSIRIYDWSV